MRSFEKFWVFGAIVGLSVAAGSIQASSAHPTIGPVTTRQAAAVYRSPQGQVRFDACKSSGGVSVAPCPIVLTVSNPSVAVTITAPPGTISETDNCGGPAGVATISGSGTSWIVSAGSTVGKCKAKFTDRNAKGHKIGRAILNISNTV